MSANLITAIIGTLLMGIFLGYYIVAVRSVPLSIIMAAILLMAIRNVYDETTQARTRRNSETPPAPPIT